MKSVLKIFVTEHCSGCAEARHIAAGVVRHYPQLGVEVIDINAPEVIVPDMVFATPTYILNNRIVSLGNPGPAEVARWAANIMLPPH